MGGIRRLSGDFVISAKLQPNSAGQSRRARAGESKAKLDRQGENHAILTFLENKTLVKRTIVYYL
jgi:hypothetical protein